MKDCKPAGWLPSLQLVRVPEVEEEKASKPDFCKGDWPIRGDYKLTPEQAKAWRESAPAADTQDRKAEQPNAAAQVPVKGSIEQAAQSVAKPVAAAPWTPQVGDLVIGIGNISDVEFPVRYVGHDERMVYGTHWVSGSDHTHYKWRRPTEQELAKYCRPLPTSERAEEGWIPWAGGEFPDYGDTLIEMRTYAGHTLNLRTSADWVKDYPQSVSNANGQNNFIAYRLAKAPQ